MSELKLMSEAEMAHYLAQSEATFGRDSSEVGVMLVHLGRNCFRSRSAHDQQQALRLNARGRRYLERALRVLRPIVGDEHTKVAECRGLLGQTAFALHQYDEAIRHFELALPVFESERDTGDAEYDHAMELMMMSGAYGHALFMKKRYTDALPLLRTGIEGAGRNGVPDQVCAQALASLGMAEALHGDTRAGLEFLRRAARGGDRAAHAHERDVQRWAKFRHGADWKDEGNKAFQSGDFARAFCLYTVAIDTGDEGSAAACFSNRAQVHIKLGRYTSAVRDAEAATQIDPTFKRAHLRVAAANVLLRDYKAAVAACDKCLAIDATDATAIELRAEAQAKADAEKNVTSGAAGAAGDGSAARREDRARGAEQRRVQERDSANWLESVKVEVESVGTDGTKQTLDKLVALLVRQCGKHLDAFARWYQDANSAHERATWLKLCFPYLVENVGGTVDNLGNDLHSMAYLCPEMSVENLCYVERGAGLIAAYREITAAGTLTKLLCDDALGIKTVINGAPTPRVRWLKGVGETDSGSDRHTRFIIAENAHHVVTDLAKVQATLPDVYHRVMNARECVPGWLYHVAVKRRMQVLHTLAFWMEEFIQEHGDGCDTQGGIFEIVKEARGEEE
jgi:tetratricopeptide (TPR) repeat protein